LDANMDDDEVAVCCPLMDNVGDSANLTNKDVGAPDGPDGPDDEVVLASGA
jgi:hypothetical protein